MRMSLNVSMNLVHLLYDLALPDGALSDPSTGRWLHVEIVVTTGEAPEHSSKQFVGEGFCCTKVILLIMGYLPFRNLIKFSQVHDEIMIFEDSHVNLSGDEGIFANRISFS